MPDSSPFDVAIIGAGAAGMMCAAAAGRRGARVVLVDHAPRLAEKIRISGGGRCNFTNVDAGDVARYVSGNPAFARSALARYRPADFIALVRRHRIGFHEKHRGQLFCDDSAQRIIDMLVAECDAGGVQWRRRCAVRAVRRHDGRALRYAVDTDAGTIETRHLVIATGGMSIPAIGATDFAYRVARQFGLRVVEPRPALVPLTFDARHWRPFAELSGASCTVRVTCDAATFDEDLLFTHRGLSGPAVLQISSYWVPRTPIVVDLVPSLKAEELLAELRDLRRQGRQSPVHALRHWLPQRLAERAAAIVGLPEFAPEHRLAEFPDTALRALANGLKAWSLIPTGTEGFRKAEVTRGGVATDELSQATFEAHRAPGLHFIGEAVDVTGWLGGYNFQWAWASGHAAGVAVAAGKSGAA